MPLDLSTFEALGVRDQREPCKVAEALGRLKPADAKVADQGLRHESAVIRRGAARWLHEQGLEVSSAAVTAHRTDKCRCAHDRAK